MAAQPPRRRGPADPSARKTVKTSLVVDTDLHVRWATAAAMSGQDRNAFAVDVLRAAVKHLVIIDRKKTPGRVDPAGEGIGGTEAA